jgi:hypothetical protein
MVRAILYSRRKPTLERDASPKKVEHKPQRNNCIDGEKTEQDTSAKGYGITQHRTSLDTEFPQKRPSRGIPEILATWLQHHGT